MRNVTGLEFGINIKVDAPADLETTLGIINDEILAAGKDIGDHVHARVKDIIEDRDIYNEGTLHESITYEAELVAAMLTVTVGTEVYYAKYVEGGTVPHFVPFHIAKSLYNQVKNDWGWDDAGIDEKGRWLLRPEPDAEPVYGIMVSGRAQPFLFPGWEESIGFIQQRIDLAGERINTRFREGSG